VAGLSRRRLPSAAQRPEQVDLDIGDLRIRRRQIGLGIGESAFGIEQRQGIDIAFALARAGDVHRRLRLVDARLKRGAAIKRMGIGRQRGFGFLQRASTVPSNVASASWLSASAAAIRARAGSGLMFQLISPPSSQRSGPAPKMSPKPVPVDPPNRRG
jgi:hypothetical protein